MRRNKLLLLFLVLFLRSDSVAALWKIASDGLRRAGSLFARETTSEADSVVAVKKNAATDRPTVTGPVGTRNNVQDTNPAASCPGPDTPGFEGVLALRAKLKEQGFTSDRPIVIGAGEGTTGTRTLTKLSHDLGLRAAHCLICTADLSKIGRRMTAIHPSNYSTTNWPAFLTKYDAVFDTPVSALFPVLFAAFPNARVVHSVRASLEWSMRRDEKHRRGPGPLAFFFASDPRLAHKPNKLRTDPKRRKKANSSSADAPTAAPWAVHAAATRMMERAAAALTCLLAAGTHLTWLGVVELYSIANVFTTCLLSAGSRR